MANKSGMFLEPDQRLSLIMEIQQQDKVGGLETERACESSAFGTGCLHCGEDDDHANILLCEGCNDEYHTYCLDPPLRSVPTGDWYCSKCNVPSLEADSLDQLIGALPSTITERYSEVCWAQGGIGFGYWPAIIYDPRLTVGSARQLAKKHLGKKFLVFFFECHDAPFAVLAESKIQKWEDGLIDDLHLGKAARSSGKVRFQMFQQALQEARIEAGKPRSMRMDWNNKKTTFPYSQQAKDSPLKSLKRGRDATIVRHTSPRRLKRGFKLMPSTDSPEEGRAQSANLLLSIERCMASNVAIPLNKHEKNLH